MNYVFIVLLYLFCSNLLLFVSIKYLFVKNAFDVLFLQSKTIFEVADTWGMYHFIRVSAYVVSDNKQQNINPTQCFYNIRSRGEYKFLLLDCTTRQLKEFRNQLHIYYRKKNSLYMKSID